MNDPTALVYPVGILVMGKELRLRNRSPTAAEDSAREKFGPLSWVADVAHHVVTPFAYHVVRFAPAGQLVPFGLARHSIIRIETIHAFGPALIERVVMSGDILYDKKTTNEGDGKLFYCPYRILEESHPIEIDLRCLPELFMLGARNPENREDLSIEERELIRGHDSLHCDDCDDFRKRTGLEP